MAQRWGLRSQTPLLPRAETPDLHTPAAGASRPPIDSGGWVSAPRLPLPLRILGYIAVFAKDANCHEPELSCEIVESSKGPAVWEFAVT